MAIIHLVLFKWKPQAQPAAIDDMMRALAALRPIPGVDWLYTGEDFTLKAAGYTHALASQHVDRAALALYRAHPDHVAVKPGLDEIAQDILIFDFERPSS